MKVTVKDLQEIADYLHDKDYKLAPTMKELIKRIKDNLEIRK